MSNPCEKPELAYPWTAVRQVFHQSLPSQWQANADTRLAMLLRGTFLGSAWGPFQDVKKVWAEHFGSKPYKSHALGIAGIPS